MSAVCNDVRSLKRVATYSLFLHRFHFKHKYYFLEFVNCACRYSAFKRLASKHFNDLGFDLDRCIQ